MSQPTPIRVLTDVKCPHCEKGFFAGVGILGPIVEFVATQELLDKSKERVLRAVEESGADEGLKEKMLDMYKSPSFVVSPTMADDMIAEIKATFGDKLIKNTDEALKPTAE